MARFVRTRPDTGELFVEHRYRDGLFRLGNPALGNKKHHKGNQVAVRTEEEVARLVTEGYWLRMKGQDTGAVSLIPPCQIRL